MSNHMSGRCFPSSPFAVRARLQPSPCNGRQPLATPANVTRFAACTILPSPCGHRLSRQIKRRVLVYSTDSADRLCESAISGQTDRTVGVPIICALAITASPDFNKAQPLPEQGRDSAFYRCSWVLGYLLLGEFDIVSNEREHQTVNLL